jgi:hypothetical protein
LLFVLILRGLFSHNVSLHNSLYNSWTPVGERG